MISKNAWKLIESLVQAAARGEISEVSVTDGDIKVSFDTRTSQQLEILSPAETVSLVSVNAENSVVKTETIEIASEEFAAEQNQERIWVIRAPAVGHVEFSAGNDAGDYCCVGQCYESGQIVFGISSLQLTILYAIRIKGMVREILVPNHAPVEYDQPLLLIELASDQIAPKDQKEALAVSTNGQKK